MEQYIEFATNHYLLVIALVVVTFLLIQDFVESAFGKFSSLSPLMAVTKMNSNDTKIVDVREPHEFVKGHIEDAINLPLGKLEEQIGTLAKYKKNTIIVVCQSGTRATSACKTLIKENFETVFNISGGMQSWEDSKLPMTISSKNKS